MPAISVSSRQSRLVMRPVGHAPRAQVRVDAERHDVVRPVGALELRDRRLVEVVVVVVADDDRVEAGDLGDAARDRVQALRPGDDRRRRPAAEDGVEQEAAAVELDDARRVAVPRHREVGGLVRVPGRHERHGAAGTPATELADHRRQACCPGPRPRTSPRRASARASGTRRRGSSATRWRAGAPSRSSRPSGGGSGAARASPACRASRLGRPRGCGLPSFSSSDGASRPSSRVRIPVTAP